MDFDDFSGFQLLGCKNSTMKICQGNACYMRHHKNYGFFLFTSGCLNLTIDELSNINYHQNIGKNVRYCYGNETTVCEMTNKTGTCICSNNLCNEVEEAKYFSEYESLLFENIDFDEISHYRYYLPNDPILQNYELRNKYESWIKGNKSLLYDDVLYNNGVKRNEEVTAFVCSTSPRLICDQSYKKVWLFKKIEILNLLKKYDYNLKTSKLTTNDYIIKDKYCRNVLESPILIEEDLFHISLSCVWFGNGVMSKCMPISDNDTKIAPYSSTVVLESDVWKKKYFNFAKIFGCDTNKYQNFIDNISEVYICKEFCVASGFGPFYQLILLFTIILNVIDYNFLSYN